ncbi:hypothetical protein HPB51_024697 [Rhipicephalus microplus]|uniref:Uncharacterized protein n=1 Tax=Rhipicephalus microplus TaxID=6941 RepID=A0A9J6E5C2_RHIMP|nr:hypothetical protein HPB51_024697 [Rhipicephalus microplus]
MNATIPSPPFLQCPGVPPISRKQWCHVLQIYIDAAARYPTPEHKKALLLNALGVGGLNTYLHAAKDEPQSGADRPTQETTPDVFDAAHALLNELFDPHPDAACLRDHFKALRQGPDQSAVELIQEVRRVAKLCEFGAAGDIFAFDQMVSGIVSPQLLTFFKMGKGFTLQKALDVAREKECVDSKMLQLSGVQVNAVASRLAEDGGSAHQAIQDSRPKGGRPPQALLQDGAGGTSPVCTSTPSAAADSYSPASPPARAGACYRCG